jgi:Ran-binding protein 1
LQVKLEEVEVKSGEEDEVGDAGCAMREETDLPPCERRFAGCIFSFLLDYLMKISFYGGLQDVVYIKRAKLFIYGETLLDKGTGNKTWKERGIGEVRLLRHKEHQRIRLLMRQEKTMKVIANHAVDPRIKLEPNVGNDRSWVWSAFDFADEELKETVFALRFSDSDLAKDFQKAFQTCQQEMSKVLAGEDTPGADGGAAAEEAAEALAGLSTKDKQKEEEETKEEARAE